MSSNKPSETGVIVSGGYLPDGAAMGVGADEALAPAAAPNPLHQMHALLRGRYWIAATLAVIGLTAGAMVGYRLQKPLYQSTALLRVRPNLPRLVYQSDQNGLMPMFDAFVEAQEALLQDQQVIIAAMEDPEWRALGRGNSPEEKEEFTKNLTANHPRNGELVIVNFTDRDPNAARIAINCVFRAYDAKFGEKDAENTQQLLDTVRAVMDEQTRAFNNARAAVQDAAKPLDPDGVKQRYEAKLQQWNLAEAQLQQANFALSSAAQSPATQPVKQDTVQTLERMALHVPDIARLLTSKRDLERQLIVDRKQLGEHHRSVIDAKAQLDALNAQIEELANAYRPLIAGSDAQLTRATLTPEGPSREQLLGKTQELTHLTEQARADVNVWSAQWKKVQEAQANADAIKQRLDETTKRYQELDTENRSRLARITHEIPSTPLAPEKDKRLAFAAAGGLGLAGAGIGLVLLIGFLDRRVRHISDVPVSRRCNRILGVLPLLPDEESDPEQAMLAAHGVHQIRMLLQQDESDLSRKPVYAITSASPGAGKTSLTLALGLSFAASGARTLLIDVDMVGGGLTAKMKKVTRRRLGHVLRRLGLIDSRQLLAALKESMRRSEPIGQTLIRQGFATQADIDHALDVQQHTVVGLREALQGDPVNECITGAGSANLFIMPLGTARRQHASQLSYPALRRLIDQVRGWADVVLIDTGPILGSLEAAAAAMAADEVVLTVARGEQRPLIQRAIDRVTGAGGKLAGIVMNRASAADIAESSFSSSSCRSDGAPSATCTRGRKILAAAGEHDALRLGPIGTAVVALAASPSDDARPA